MADHVGDRKLNKRCPSTALSGAINDAVTTINGTSFAGWPEPTTGQVAAAVIDEGLSTEEVIWYASRTDTALSGVERGQDNTVAVAHAAGATIAHPWTASAADEANLHVTDVTRHDHTQYPRRSQAETVSGNWIFSGTPTFTDFDATNADITTLSITTADGNPNFTGTPVFNAATVTNDLSVGDDLTVAGDTTTAAVTSTAITADSVTASTVTATDATITDLAFSNVSEIAALLLPAGITVPFAGAAVPSGWLLCDGSAVSRSTYAALFTAIGTTYGIGDGSTTFNLPDMRGKMPLGVSGSYSLASTGGAASKTLSTGEMPSHSHTITITDPGHKHNMDGDSGNRYVVTAPSSSLNLPNTGTQAVSYSDIDTATTGITASASNTGSGTSFSILNPYVALNYIIKAA